MNKIYFVEDRKPQVKVIRRRLEKIFVESGYEIEIIYPPYRTMEEYIQHLSDPETTCFILDEKLTDKVTYTGSELAGFLRSIDPKKPIYILTSVASPPDSESVEAVIDKSFLNDNPDIVKARMLRRFDTYNDLIETRYQRYHDLLRKSLSEQLTQDEYQELQELEFINIAPTLAEEINQLEELDQLLAKQNEILAKLE